MPSLRRVMEPRRASGSLTTLTGGHAHRNRARERWRRAKPLSRHPISGLTGTLAQCNCCFGHECIVMGESQSTKKAKRAARDSARQNQEKRKGGVSVRRWSLGKHPRRRFKLRRFSHRDDLIELAFQLVVGLELAWINDRN